MCKVSFLNSVWYLRVKGHIAFKHAQMFTRRERESERQKSANSLVQALARQCTRLELRNDIYNTGITSVDCK